jgi:hydroxymethylbilane synthase
MRLGSRASALALAQAELVAARLGDCEIVPIVTRGDRGAAIEDKSRWVRELEAALIAETIDVAVHSAKDVPEELAAGLALVTAPTRGAAEDVLCGASSLDELAPAASVGTSSIRRAAQLRAARADVRVVSMRGNVDTRLAKLARRECDAIVLARAGIERLGRAAEIGAVLDPTRFVPAPGQGTLALQARAGDSRVQTALEALGDEQTFATLLAERALARALGASCDTPLGAYAAPSEEGLLLRAWVGLPDGSVWISDELCGDASAPEALGREVAARLELAGARDILRRAHELAA